MDMREVGGRRCILREKMDLSEQWRCVVRFASIEKGVEQCLFRETITNKCIEHKKIANCYQDRFKLLSFMSAKRNGRFCCLSLVWDGR